jgi:4-amino-4-deoxy-L-arabinose transferase-like glycosyltransferase
MPSFLNSPRAQAFVLAVIVFFLFWWRLGTLGLIDPDEPFYAMTTREMVQSGDWVTPRLFGEPQFEKPILFYWQTCLSQTVFGDNEFAARLPGTLAATFLVFLTWGIGRKLLSPTAGFLSAVVLATGSMFVIMSRLMLTDISHTVFITTSMFCLWRAFHDEDNRLRWLITLTVASALAMLTKGPQGLFFVIMAGFSYSWVQKLKQPWSAKSLAICIPLWLLIATPWYLAMFTLHQSGPTAPGTGWSYYWNSFFVHENWDRFFHSEHQGNNTWYYYLEILIGGTLPWIPLTLAAIWQSARTSFKDLSEHKGLCLILCWLIPSYIFMNITQTKIPSYAFFLLVPLALLAGHTLERWLKDGFTHREFWFVSIFTLIEGVLLIWYTPAFHPRSMPFLAQLIALGLPLTLAGICALRKNTFGWVAFSTSFSLVLIFIAFFWIEDRLDGTVGSRDICKIAAEVRKPNETLITCSFLGRAANYYLKEKPAAIFVSSPKTQEGKAKDNFRPFYPFYSYHALRQIKLETELLNFVQEKGSVLCIGEQRDFELLNTGQVSSVKGHCELLGATGEKPGRAVFRIHSQEFKSAKP